MDQFAAVRLFTDVVEAGNFSAAARRLGLTPSAIARQVAALEEHLGTRLLNRTTRRMELTEAGRVYHARALRLVRDFDALNRDVTEMEATPRGLLRVSASHGLGGTLIAAQMPAFIAAHPEVRVELVLDDRVVDLLEERIDLALRIATRLPDSSLIARRLFRYRRVICASPAYLAAHGTPQHPEELSGHECLTFLAEGRHDLWGADGRIWHLRGHGREVAVPVSGRLDSNSRMALIEVALNGLGLILAPGWQVAGHLASGALRTVLEDYEVDPHADESHVYAVYATNRHLSPRVRAFVDFIATRLGDGAGQPPSA